MGYLQGPYGQKTVKANGFQANFQSCTNDLGTWAPASS